MAITEITSDIQNITGVGTADTGFIETAQRFVSSSIPKQLLWFAGVQSSAIQDANGFDVSSSDTVLAVEREGYPASEVPFDLSKSIDDSASLHKVTNSFPKFYTAQGKVFIKPDPAGGGAADGYVYYVDYSQIDDDCDLRSAVIYHACSSEYSKLSTSFTSPGVFSINAVPPDSISDTISDFSLSSEFDDAMLNAKNLIDNDVPASGNDVFDLLSDEDTELVQATLQTAAQEIQRANAELQSSLQTFNTDMQKFQASGTGKFSADVTAYQAEVTADVQEYTQKLAQYQLELSTSFQAWSKVETDFIQNSDRYYKMAQSEIQKYIQNNSKMIQSTAASQAAQQRA